MYEERKKQMNMITDVINEDYLVGGMGFSDLYFIPFLVLDTS